MSATNESVCAKCRNCRKPKDRPDLTMSWGCAAAEPYNMRPASIDPQTGERIPGAVWLLPCVWQNPLGECDLFEAGDPQCSGRDARPLPPPRVDHPRRTGGRIGSSTNDLDLRRGQTEATVAVVAFMALILFAVLSVAIAGGHP